MSKKISKSERTKMIMEIDYLYGRVNELFELYDEGDINEIKAHKLFRECCVKFLWKVNGISGGKEWVK
mgnify:FL=1|tara:strand:+ start:366 stop:569 length:204 start_codon:yes stop_codon:yes gene_type:complete